MLQLLPVGIGFLLASLTLAAPNARDFVVYGFSQSDVDGEDPQVYELEPDVTIRAIGKWSNNGSEVEDYNFAQIGRYHAHNITFMGSGTASVIFPQDFPNTEIFDAMSTQDADGNIVPHGEFGFPTPARRGNLFNPAYRGYLLAWAKIQIDGGVDGVNFDEVNGGFSGGQKYSFNGNEGFDNFTLADFNRYLLEKYPNLTADDWKAKFKLAPNNLLSRDIPPSDLTRNFNYRTYLKESGWNLNPLNTSNPLAAEWGKVVSNRLYSEDMSFTAVYTRRYWKELIDNLRQYARQTQGREILISSNGLWPYVDFNTVGMYPWNPDEQTSDYRGADYVPILEGRLNGAKSLQRQYGYLKEQSRRIAGDDVPVAVFIDWPNDMMTGYLNLPLEDKKNYWRIFGAEAYANGLFPAFHLRDTVGSPTARDAGVLDFFRNYTAFYKRNRALFRDNMREDTPVKFNAEGLYGTVLAQKGTASRTVHIVNHVYERGQVTPLTGVALVDFPVEKCPSRVDFVSPDLPVGDVRKSSFTCGNQKLRVKLEVMHHYGILVLVD